MSVSSFFWQRNQVLGMIEIDAILAPDQRAVREKTVILIWVITVNAWPFCD